MEELIHYVWEHKLYHKTDLRTTAGEKVEVIKGGVLNKSDGPDFFDAIIIIDGIKWCGNVEIHILASQWYQHKHQLNSAYDSIILHVVIENDASVYRSNDQLIPCLELSYPKFIEENYKDILKSRLAIPCSRHLKKLDSMTRVIWLTRLLIDRIEQRHKETKLRLMYNNGDYEETLHCMMLRNLGASLNGDSFEQLGRILPLKLLQKHRDNLLQLECLLLGVAGFLDDKMIKDEYGSELQKEFSFLQKKYQLVILDRSVWKFLRLRPSNFPTLRLAQWAKVIQSTPNLFSKIINLQEVSDMHEFLKVKASKYWDTHYVIGKESSLKKKHFGKTIINSMLINSIIPFIFIYGKETGEDDLDERTISLLEQMEPESNHIIEDWNECGIIAKNAFESQALIHLRKKYCDQKACLRCRIGQLVFKIDE